MGARWQPPNGRLRKAVGVENPGPRPTDPTARRPLWMDRKARHLDREAEVWADGYSASEYATAVMAFRPT